MTGAALHSAREVPLVVGRTPLLPEETVNALYDARDAEHYVRDLMARRPEIAQAVYAASPSLGEAVSAWLRGEPWSNKRGFLRLAAYIVRMASRATPFGLFATIAHVDVAGETTLSLGGLDTIRTHSRPDMAWLLGLVRDVEAREDVRDRLPVFWNDHALERGGRIHVKNPDGRAFTENNGTVGVEYAPISLRKTAAVEFIAAAAADGITLGELQARVVEAFAAEPQAVRRMLQGMVKAGVLLSDLRPAPVDDPVAAAEQALRPVTPETADAVLGVRAELRRLDATPVAERTLDDYRRAHDVIGAVAATSFAFQIDSTHEFSGTLGSHVLGEVETLARILLRSNASLRMKAYRDRFLERYGGYERRVPLLELVDTEFGIGPPLALEGSQLPVRRRQALLELAARACRAGCREISLTQGELDEIIGPDPSPGNLPSSFEIGFAIAAHSAEAIDRGEYLILPAAMKSSPGAARSIGRFADALGPQVGTRIANLLQYERERDQRCHAELVYFPSRDRVINVAIRPQYQPYEIQFGVRRSLPNVQRLPLSDILIGIEEGRFRAWSRSLERELRITESHLLTADANAPEACTFLAAMSEDGMTFPSGFNWGAAGALAALPRLRFGRIVLVKALWHLDRSRLNGDVAALAKTLGEYRAHLGMPDDVMLVERDNRLPIRISSPLGLAVLHDQLRSVTDEVVRFEEVLPEPGDLWMSRSGDGYAAEFVASLVTTAQRAALPLGARPDERRDNRSGPGSEWCYAKLYCGRSNIDALLVTSVAPLLNGLIEQGIVDRWFFIRYQDPDWHVRLRMRATAAGRGRLLAATAERCEQLLSAGLVERYAFDTYAREFERYGGAQHFDDAESIFHRDSMTALEALRERPSTRDARIRLALETVEAALLRLLPGDLVETALNGARDKHRRLSAPAQTMIKDLQAAAASAPREASPGALAYLVDPRTGAEPLTRPPAEIVRSFVHMHFNRMGVHDEDESVATEMALRVQRGLARRKRAAPSEQLVV